MKFLIIASCFLAQFTLCGQCSNLVCNSETATSLNNKGEGILLPEFFMVGDFSDCNLQVGLVDINTFEFIEEYQDTIDISCDYVGVFIVRVLDIDSGNSCFGELNIYDNLNVCTSSINDIEQVETYQTDQYLHINLNNAPSATMHIFNLSGQRILSQTLTNSEMIIDLSSEVKSTGLHIVSIAIAGQIHNKMVLIN